MKTKERVNQVKKIFQRIFALLLIICIAGTQCPELCLAEEGSFMVYYHETLNSEACGVTTEAVYGGSTSPKTIDELNFSQEGMKFSGWAVQRSSDNYWRYVDSDGNAVWASECPDGGNYYVYGANAVLSKTAPAGSELHMYALWKDNHFIIQYHENLSADVSAESKAVYGGNDKATSIARLGFSQDGKQFSGWIAYRESDKCWRFSDGNGSVVWAEECPAGYSYALYSDEVTLRQTTAAGTVLHLYAQWSENYFTVKYHEDIGVEASKQTTQATYGGSTVALSAETLGFSKINKKFAGWSVYREKDKCWRFVSDSDSSKTIWATECPDGYSYYIYPDECILSKTAPAGTVLHLYAQWEDNYFSVRYHETFNSEASDITTKVIYGENTTLLSYENLSFSQEGMVFCGWAACRESDKYWRFVNINDNTDTVWAAECPEGYSYYLYADQASIARTVSAGDTVDFYAQWEDNYFTIKYYAEESTNPSDQISRVIYGEEKKLISFKTLGFQQSGKVFIGWIAYRESDKCWRFVNDETGDAVWAAECPDGYTYYTYSDEAVVSKTSLPNTTVRMYAQWTSTDYSGSVVKT